MIHYVRQVFLLLGMMLFGFAAYVVLFWIAGTSLNSVLFYRGLYLALIAGVITAVVAFVIGKRIGDPSFPVAATAISLSFNICFLVLLPVTVDRSVSVYLLANIASERGTGILPADLERQFIDGYVVKMGAINRRIDEQKTSGNIEMGVDGKVHLTAQGRHFMALSHLISRIFHTDPRFVDASDDKVDQHVRIIAGQNEK